ncbi:DUF6152 family protein [Chelativorans salis]|uniref:DUF6152 family protein n=1 Tax=Chelativorans salis TaxID=2978478 RepID=A0ABT2LSM1_9HYPH|nr:DUF6152 family protein [Chelativorans sp. EGI FJ00035]MCT7376383.1 DUF6152 family protein [Chelativorans sp. EGI FJ00035]
MRHHTPRRFLPRILALGVGLAAGAVPALAHHGWAWTENEPFELTGSIEDIYIGNPHVTLSVRAEDGLWHVDLAPLAPTLRAGFDEGAAEIGDTVTCVGFRSSDRGEMSMKAARVVIDGETYDVYPNRVPDA